ncbi:hypothetical protein [Actinospongicola halichondriae]|uniref:hypothetical protein n=1 Tax=Actinospongicola halichondriae TaxID=3236844 RepID=UPI003D4F918C
MDTLATVTGTVLAGIAYDPTIRGILAVGVGVVVLMGSVYLLLGTNTGNRLGFLLAATGFFGWMAIMGLIWWIYGIGMLGDAPAWHIVEYNTTDTALAVTEDVQELDKSVVPAEPGAIATLSEEDPEAFAALQDQVHEDSNGWILMSPTDAVRNEIEATVSAELPECAECDFGISSAADYLSINAYQRGGKERLPENPSRWDRITNTFKTSVQLQHPPRYAVLEVQKVIEQETEPGQAPPSPKVDESEPVVSVVMLRDIGDRRFPSAVITISSTLIFLLLCWVLHQRERILEENLENAQKAGV